LADPSKIAPSTRKKAQAEAWARRVEAKMDRGEFADLKAASRRRSENFGGFLLRTDAAGAKML
jgi:hypothetical protein